MLCVTFYNKQTQLRLDCINSFSVTNSACWTGWLDARNPVSLVVLEEYYRVPQSLTVPLLGTTVLLFLLFLKQTRISILQAVRDNFCLQKAIEHPSRICGHHPDKRSAAHPPQPPSPPRACPLDCDSWDLSPACTSPRGPRTVRLEHAEPEKGRTNGRKTDPL